MGVITGLEPQEHDPERISVFVDGRFAIGTTRFHAVSAGLALGQEVSETQLAELAGQDAAERAYDRALRFLSYRPRSRDEIERYFHRRGVDAAAAEAALARLERNGLINDAEFAGFWVDNRQRFSPRGTRALRSELRQKGVQAEVIDAALAELPDEAQAAYEAGRRRARSLSQLDQAEFSRKMLAFLQRRGFGYEAARDAIQRLWDEPAEADAAGTDDAP